MVALVNSSYYGERVQTAANAGGRSLFEETAVSGLVRKRSNFREPAHPRRLTAGESGRSIGRL